MSVEKRRKAPARAPATRKPARLVRPRRERDVSADLEPRVRPIQQRAQESVALILDTATELLRDGGVEGLTTKRIAERAGIRVRSVYRYFPNKLAVIRALAERVAQRQKTVLQVATRESDEATPWRVAMRHELRALVRSFKAEPGLAAIRRAMQSCPALREVDEKANDEIARLWASDLASRGLRGSASRRLLVVRTAVQIAAALLDPIEREQGRDEAARIRELEIVLESYLANYLDPKEPRD